MALVCCSEKAMTYLAKKILQDACRHGEVETADAGLIAVGSPYTDQKLWSRTTSKEWWDYIIQMWEKPAVASKHLCEEGHIPEAVGGACPFTSSLKTGP